MSSDSAAETTVLVVRHGETEWNLQSRIQGHSNSELTPLGRIQAEAAANLLHKDTALFAAPVPTALYTSDLGRALETTRTLAERLGFGFAVEPALREMNFGRLEGMTYSEVEREFPELGRKLWGEELDPEARPPHGESRAQMHDRSVRAIENLAQRHLGETVAVVSHGGVIDYFFRGVVGIPFRLKSRFWTENGSIAAFGYREGRFKLRAWGIRPKVQAR